MSAAVEKLWGLLALDRVVRAADIRDIANLIEDEIDQARQEGWQDGYFEAGGLGGLE